MLRAVYYSMHYEMLRDRVLPRGLPGPGITLSDRVPAIRDQILADLEQMSTERVGVLHGEYLVMENGLLLLDRRGVQFGVCMAMDHWSVCVQLDARYEQPRVKAHLQACLAAWNRLPLVRNPRLLSDPFVANYYHYSLEIIPRLRHLGPIGTLMMPRVALSTAFQRDLLAHTASAMGWMPLDQPMRVLNPVVAHETLNAEGYQWLREASGIAARPGDRRIYLRRSGPGTRTTAGGGIAETEGFLTLLRDFGFEILALGAGEPGVAEQVAMLDGAGLILSAHGATLANLAYLSPPLTVIEVFGPSRCSCPYLQLAIGLGFDYHGVCSDAEDAQLDILVDLDELRDILHHRLAPRPRALPVAVEA